MATESDDWGRDPQVRALRKVFARMEAAQRELLTALEVEVFDPRLRRWREKALDLFEKAWSKGAQKGMRLGEEELAAVYARCFVKVVERERGVPVAIGELPGGYAIASLVEEVVS